MTIPCIYTSPAFWCNDPDRRKGDGCIGCCIGCVSLRPQYTRSGRLLEEACAEACEKAKQGEM